MDVPQQPQQQGQEQPQQQGQEQPQQQGQQQPEQPPQQLWPPQLQPPQQPPPLPQLQPLQQPQWQQQKWQAYWQELWQQWQVRWTSQWQHWMQMDKPLQQWEHWQLQWREQWDQWQLRWQDQWQLRQQHQQHWQHWQQQQEWQHQVQWQIWQHQCYGQWQLWQQLGEWQFQQWHIHQSHPQFEEWQLLFQKWQLQWQEQWKQWLTQWQIKCQQYQEQCQQFQRQRQWQWLLQNEPNKNKRLRLTKSMNFIPLSHVLVDKPLTNLFVCDGIEMTENTDFGNMVADGFVSEIFEANDQDLSWAGNFSEDDLLVSEDGRFVTIAAEPKERATNENRFLDLSQIITVLLVKYHREMMPPYLVEFIVRVNDLPNKAGNQLLISLWVIKNHPFFMGPERWRAFLEDYYRWYKKMDPTRRDELILVTNEHLCRDWHLYIVRQNKRLDTVYWSGRRNLREIRLNPKVEDNEAFRFTGQDGYLAIFQRLFVVHGIQILGGDLSLKELAYLVAYFFGTFLPRFLAQIFKLTYANRDEVFNEHYILEETLLRYIKRRSSSWRNNQGQ